MGDDGPGRLRVLYVDGDADARTAVAECLEGADRGVEAVRAPDSAAALGAVRDERIDCVVSDQTLPDGTGLGLLEAVRERHPAMPFVLYPSEGSEALAAEAIRAGVSSYRPRTSPAGECEQLRGAVVSAVDEQTDRRAALDRMTDGFFVLDGEWRITYANERARDILREATSEGADVDDLRGVSLWDAVPAAVDTTFYYE